MLKQNKTSTTEIANGNPGNIACFEFETLDQDIDPIHGSVSVCLHVLVHLRCHLHSVTLYFIAMREFPTFKIFQRETPAACMTCDIHISEAAVCKRKRSVTECRERKLRD